MTLGLRGVRVVNTRALHQAEELDAALRKAGGIPISYPCIHIEPPSDPSDLDRALNSLSNGGYDWLVLTSGNAVHALDQREFNAGHDHCFRVAAIGPATKAQAECRLGLVVDFVPTAHTACDLAEQLPFTPGERLLVPAASITRRELSESIKRRGGHPTVVTAYRTVTGSGGAALRQLLEQHQVDAFAFASPSAVDGIFARLTIESCQSESISRFPAACIGPTTAEAAIARGLLNVRVSSDATVSSLVTALESFGIAREGEPSWS